ncbi:MAG: proline dehydrogenase family protein [Planctomycetes bacterium]|nr:proline dehydrogenase family protein [Planctomycetota bacterium]
MSRQSWLQNMCSTAGPFKIFSRRFIAGETLADAVKSIRELNQHGISATLDHLGESVCDRPDACAATDVYIRILDAIQSESINSTASLKPTNLGLDIDYDFCLTNIRSIMQRAKKAGNLVTIDMESSAYTDLTLKLYETLVKEGFSNAGIVIQSYLRRSEADIRKLIDLSPRIRLCKGAYKEPDTVAFPSKKDVDKNYIKLLEIMLARESLDKGAYPEIASHDDRIINWVFDYARKNNTSADKFEFQMLYGIRRDLQEKIVKSGYRMRVYVPYGTHWYPYFMRRLAERPANVGFLIKNVCRW